MLETRFTPHATECAQGSEKRPLAQATPPLCLAQLPGNAPTLLAQDTACAPDAELDVMNILAAMPLFAGLAPAHLLDLARGSHTAVRQKGETIFHTGDTTHVLYLVLSGHVKRAILMHEGNEKLIDLVPPGKVFGLTELLGARACAAYAVAVTRVVLLCIGGGNLRRTIEVSPTLALRVLRAQAERQYDMECDLAARGFRSGCQRTLDYLLQLAGNRYSPTGETVVSLQVSKLLIAAHIGITPESLSRALRGLSDEGLILVDGRRICLQNANIARYRAKAPIDAAGSGFPGLRHRPNPRFSETVPRREALSTADRCRVLPICSAINMAGRQRMLSQRMAKDWALLGQNVQSEKSRGNLLDSISLFESQLADLSAQPLCREERAAQEALSDAWLPYKALLGCPPGKGSAILVFDQSERVLALAHGLTQTLAEMSGTPASHLINLAGRPRMLSQRIAKFFLFRQWGIAPLRCCEELEKSGDEMSNTLGELLEAPLGSPPIRAKLIKVTHLWGLLQTALARSADDGGPQAASRIVSSSERILHNSDAAVSLYEALAADTLQSA